MRAGHHLRVTRLTLCRRGARAAIEKPPMPLAILRRRRPALFGDAAGGGAVAEEGKRLSWSDRQASLPAAGKEGEEDGAAIGETSYVIVGIVRQK
jgi:hypothetical protein